MELFATDRDRLAFLLETDAALDLDFEALEAQAEAYEVLHDPEKRQLYDRYGHAGLQGTGFHGFRGFDDIFSSFGDIFEDFFGFGSGFRSGRRVIKGADLKYNLNLSFLDAAFGVKKPIEILRTENCHGCNGSGLAHGFQRDVCRTCRGKGQIVRSQGFIRIATTCPNCNGAGSMIRHPCDVCRGAGRIQTKKKLEVDIPPGVDTGMSLKIKGEGEPHPSGNGPPGDLYVQLYVEAHDLFQRKGEDVICPVPVSFVQAALGTNLEVPTLEGIEKIVLPEGTQHGDILKLKGKGIPNVDGSGRGDLVIKVDIHIPTKLNKRQQELLREFARFEKEKDTSRSHAFFSKRETDNRTNGNSMH